MVGAVPPFQLIPAGNDGVKLAPAANSTIYAHGGDDGLLVIVKAVMFCVYR